MRAKEVSACNKIAPLIIKIIIVKASKSLFGIISSSSSLLFRGSTRLDNLLITIKTNPTNIIDFLGQINSLKALATVIFDFSILKLFYSKLIYKSQFHSSLLKIIERIKI